MKNFKDSTFREESLIKFKLLHEYFVSYFLLKKVSDFSKKVLPFQL